MSRAETSETTVDRRSNAPVLELNGPEAVAAYP